MKKSTIQKEYANAIVHSGYISQQLINMVTFWVQCNKKHFNQPNQWRSKERIIV